MLRFQPHFAPTPLLRSRSAYQIPLLRPNVVVLRPRSSLSGGGGGGGGGKLSESVVKLTCESNVDVLRPGSSLGGGGDGGGKLSESVVKLTCESSAKGGICNIHLIRTLPFTLSKDDSLERKQSCNEVKDVINSLKPEVVFLGLCPTLGHDLSPSQMLRRILGRWLDFEVTAEFRVANEEARKLGGKVILGNRPDKITMHKSWDPSLMISLLVFAVPHSHWTFMEWIFTLDPDFLPDNKAINILREGAKDEKEVYIDECAQYMSSTLLKVAREHSSIVAVVRSIHFSEIQKYWNEPIEAEDLLEDKWGDGASGVLVKRAVFVFLFLFLLGYVIYSILRGCLLILLAPIKLFSKLKM